MDIQIIDIPTIDNTLGNIAVIENDVVPFNIKRVYYLFDVPSTAVRGGHAHKALKQMIVPLSGSFDVVLKDGTNEKKFTLNKPNKGLLLNSNIWRELENFSSGAVCMVLASDVYNEEDYIRDYNDFLAYIKSNK